MKLNSSRVTVKTCPPQAGAADEGSRGFQGWVLETEENQISA